MPIRIFIKTIGLISIIFWIHLPVSGLSFGVQHRQYGFTPRWGASAGVLKNGKVVVSGGFNGKDTGITEIYSPENGRWVQVASDPIARTSASAVVLSNGDFFVTGGYNQNYLNVTEVYDVFKNAWVQKSPDPTPRAGATAVLLKNGSVFVTGGFN